MPRVRSPEEEAARKAKREAKREANRLARATRKALERTDPAIIAARLKARAHREQHKIRIDAIRTQIVGQYPRFAGELLTSELDVARLSDRDMLQGMGRGALRGVNGGNAAVYWADGASYNLDPGTAGSASYLGAGVVWMERDPKSAVLSWRSKEFLLGCNTGTIGDAELYAISAAMGLAIQEIENGNGDIQRVRVLTDRLGLLQAIPLYRLPLGPFISTRLSIQEVYERAEWLVAKGIKLELAWVKGHAKSRGNKEADKAALRAAQAQANASLALVAEGKKETGLTMEAPKMFEERGPIWRDEWLWRANKSLLVRKGRALGGDGVVVEDMVPDLVDGQEVEMEVEHSELELA